MNTLGFSATEESENESIRRGPNRRGGGRAVRNAGRLRWIPGSAKVPISVKGLPRLHVRMRSFSVGRLFGIPLKLDLTFLLILPVFAWLIGSQVGDSVAALNALPAADIASEPLHE